MQRHVFSGRNRALAVLLCLCMMLLLVGSSAQAEITKVTLTVKAADNFADEAEEQDFADANVVVDLYQVGSAVKDDKYDTYTYNLLAPFDGLTLKEEMTTEDWEALSKDAAAVVADASAVVAGAPVGSKIEKTDGGADLEKGLYLVIAHGDGEEDLYAESSTTIYTFTPQLVTLPTKEDVNGDGKPQTSVEDGEWIADASVTLKYETEPSKADLIIEKVVKEFKGNKASFVFLVEVYDKDGKLIGSNTAMITMTGAGTKTAKIEGLPAGSRVVVKEDLTVLTNFEIVGESEKEIKSLSATAENKVSFENKPNNSAVRGYGIENHFTYSEDESGNGTWSLEKR